MSHDYFQIFLSQETFAAGTTKQDYPVAVTCTCIEETTFITSGVVIFVFILILITVVFVFVIVLLIRSKHLIQKELQNVKGRQDNRTKGDTVYEEIQPPQASTVIETTENTAYTCISRVCANSDF